MTQRDAGKTRVESAPIVGWRPIVAVTQQLVQQCFNCVGIAPLGDRSGVTSDAVTRMTQQLSKRARLRLTWWVTG